MRIFFNDLCGGLCGMRGISFHDACQLIDVMHLYLQDGVMFSVSPCCNRRNSEYTKI